MNLFFSGYDCSHLLCVLCGVLEDDALHPHSSAADYVLLFIVGEEALFWSEVEFVEQPLVDGRFRFDDVLFR